MSKQIKAVIGSVLAITAVMAIATGAASAAESGGCACCKKMDMPMPSR